MNGHKEAADYFERNRDRMKYDEYLANGYPIGIGVVEGRNSKNSDARPQVVRRGSEFLKSAQP